MMILRVVALLCSLLGYYWLLAEQTRPEFAPGLIVTGIGSLVFLAGLANCLSFAVWLICGMGCFLMGVQLYRKRKIRTVLTFSGILLLLLCLYFLANLYGLKLTGYDDFSHWGVVARILVEENRFPNLTDQILTFQAYPVGSAALIYYFVKISGIHAEWMWLYAQAVAVLGLYLGIFAFAESWRQKAFLLLVFLILLCSNIFFINLLVDTLITACALNVMCFSLYYRDSLLRVRWWLLPYTVFLLAVKTSGMFYVLVVFGYVLLKCRKAKGWKKLFPIVLLSLLPLLLWRLHVRVVFPDGMISKHAFSFQYFAATLADKNWSGIKYILVHLMLRTFSPKLETVYLLAFLIALAALTGQEWKRKETLLREVLQIIMESACLYGVLLFIMYLISMPWYEAEQLAGFERYLRTYTGFAAGLLSIVLVRFPLNAVERGNYRRAERKLLAAQGIWIVILLFTMGRRSDFYLRWPMEHERRTYAETIIEENNLPSGKKCLVVVNDETSDKGYLEYMFRYLLNSPDVKVLTLEERKEMADTQQFDQTDYEIMWNPGSDIKD